MECTLFTHLEHSLSPVYVWLSSRALKRIWAASNSRLGLPHPFWGYPMKPRGVHHESLVCMVRLFEEESTTPSPFSSKLSHIPSSLLVSCSG